MYSLARLRKFFNRFMDKETCEQLLGLVKERKQSSLFNVPTAKASLLCDMACIVTVNDISVRIAAEPLMILPTPRCMALTFRKNGLNF